MGTNYINAVVTVALPLALMSSSEYLSVHLPKKKILKSLLSILVTFKWKSPLEFAHSPVIQALMDKESPVLQHCDFITRLANLKKVL